MGVPTDYDGAEYPGAETVDRFARVPDGLGRLWTPHRIAYIEEGAPPSESGCVFCDAPKRRDEDALIVHRGTHAYALLNLFPYNSGHLLVCPYRHVPMYDDATPDEVAELASITQQGMRVLAATSHPHGFNIGMNQGAVAGAGIADHLHQHLVPRWGGDANFFPIIAETKAIPALLGDAWRTLHDAWPTD